MYDNKEHKSSFIGMGGKYTQRSDLSELIMCKGDPERCIYPPGYHEEQERIDKIWLAEKREKENESMD